MTTPFPIMSCNHSHRILATCVCLLILLAFSANVRAEEPSKEKPPAQDKFDGLGFSVAPKQGGKARTSLFGIVGEGYKFVFVIDRSGSMGEGADPLSAVKTELAKCLKNLDTVHQFQLIFYNERPVLFNPSGKPGRLAFATDDNKRRAERFAGRVVADGGTNHEDALKMAVRMQPDVIFLLTDADKPALNAKQLAKIREMAAGIVINAVEFGAGPKPAGRGFIAELARQNGGAYAYIDTTKTADKK